jgi:hypothetical protein
MILRDSVNTFTTTYEDISEKALMNTNTVVTLGGRPHQQADSQRLQITSTLRVTRTELDALNAIISNYGDKLYYTPTRQLAYKSSIAEITVIIQSAPEIKQRAYNGAVYFHVELVMEEDPFG